MCLRMVCPLLLRKPPFPGGLLFKPGGEGLQCPVQAGWLGMEGRNGVPWRHPHSRPACLPVSPCRESGCLCLNRRCYRKSEGTEGRHCRQCGRAGPASSLGASQCRSAQHLPGKLAADGHAALGTTTTQLEGGSSSAHVPVGPRPGQWGWYGSVLIGRALWMRPRKVPEAKCCLCPP